MNTKDNKTKIEFFKLLKKGKTPKEASEIVGISSKTGYMWEKSWMITKVNILKAYEILSQRLLEAVENVDLSTYEIKELSEALKNIEESNFMYGNYIVEKK